MEALTPEQEQVLRNRNLELIELGKRSTLLDKMMTICLDDKLLVDFRNWLEVEKKVTFTEIHITNENGSDIETAIPYYEEYFEKTKIMSDAVKEARDNWENGLRTCDEYKYEMSLVEGKPNDLPNCEFNTENHRCNLCHCTDVAYYGRYFYEQVSKTDLDLGFHEIDWVNMFNGRWFECNGKTYVAYLGGIIRDGLPYIGICCTEDDIAIDMPFFHNNDYSGFYMTAYNTKGHIYELKNPYFSYENDCEFSPISEENVNKIISMVDKIMYDIIDNLESNLSK